jgi:hypothetical protein
LVSLEEDDPEGEQAELEDLVAPDGALDDAALIEESEQEDAGDDKSRRRDRCPRPAPGSSLLRAAGARGPPPPAASVGADAGPPAVRSLELLLTRPTMSARKSCRMKQMIRELKRQVAGEKLELEQLKGLIRAGYVYRNGEEHLL